MASSACCVASSARSMSRRILCATRGVGRPRRRRGSRRPPRHPVAPVRSARHPRCFRLGRRPMGPGTQRICGPLTSIPLNVRDGVAVAVGLRPDRCQTHRRWGTPSRERTAWMTPLVACASGRVSPLIPVSWRWRLTATLTATGNTLGTTPWTRWTEPRGKPTQSAPTPRHGRRTSGLLILVSWVRIPAGSQVFARRWRRIHRYLAACARFLWRQTPSDSHVDSHVERTGWT